jgi:hypothetical protein
MAAPIIVPFRGDGGGVSDLTWGQRQIWQAMVDTNTSQSMSSAAPLRGKTAADIAVDLEFLMRRHESLRTRLRFDDAGRPAQVISASGEIALHIIDAAGADPERVAGDLADGGRGGVRPGGAHPGTGRHRGEGASWWLNPCRGGW